MSETILAAGGLNRIYDPIEAVLPGVQHSVVMMACWDAVEEFCIRTVYWRQTVAWTMLAGTLIVDLNPIDGISLAWGVLNVAGLDTYRTAPPAIIIDTGLGLLNRAGTALVACKPNRLDENVVPPFIADEWSEGIRDGVLARLYMQPAKPYSSMPLASYHHKRFRSQIRLARFQASQFGDYQTWTYPYYSRGRQVTEGLSQFDGDNGNDGIGGIAPGTPDLAIPEIDGQAIIDGGLV